MAKTTKTRSKRAKTPKPARGKPVVEVFGGKVRGGFYPPERVRVDADLVPAVWHLLALLHVDSGSLEADMHGAIARVEELLP